MNRFRCPRMSELMISPPRVHTVLLRVATLETFDWDVDVLVPPRYRVCNLRHIHSFLSQLL